MTYISPKLLTFEEFIAQYGDNTRYELIDGQLRDMEPTGPHEAVAGSIAGRIYVEIFNSNFNWLVPKTCLIKPPAAEATVLRPDVIVLDDYARKVEEYAFLNIPEYWIVDFRGLGGLQFIGNPKQPTFTVCQLVNGVYQQQQYRLGDTIYSDILPNLQLKLDDLMHI